MAARTQAAADRAPAERAAFLSQECGDDDELLQPIGEGGFGTVWMAEQQEPVRRRVALKVIKLGMDTAEVVARFEAERQALAQRAELAWAAGDRDAALSDAARLARNDGHLNVLLAARARVRIARLLGEQQAEVLDARALLEAARSARSAAP